MYFLYTLNYYKFFFILLRKDLQSLKHFVQKVFRMIFVSQILIFSVRTNGFHIGLNMPKKIKFCAFTNKLREINFNNIFIDIFLISNAQLTKTLQNDQMFCLHFLSFKQV